VGHIHEKIDFVITVFIVHRSKVLFVNHPRYNKWVPIGGHVELDEDPEQTLFREVAEETGLTVEILSDKPTEKVEMDNKFLLRPNYMGVYGANPPHRHISLTYFAYSKSSKAVMSDEHTEMKWLSLSELNSSKYNLTPSLRFYATKAIEVAQTLSI
jgi:8-oxo-dGTP pyrophosphatase MutT (NUDIX family)